MNSEISYRYCSGSVTQQFRAHSFQTLDEQICEFQVLFNFNIQEYQSVFSHLLELKLLINSSLEIPLIA